MYSPTKVGDKYTKKACTSILRLDDLPWKGAKLQMKG